MINHCTREGNTANFGRYRYKFISPQLIVGLSIVLLFLSYPTLVQANAVRLNFISQNPGNTVPQGQPITYTIQTENFYDGTPPQSSIGISIRMRVNGTVVRADSGAVTTSDCIVDPSFPDYFACNNLAEGGTQTINLTWNTPLPGTSTVQFEAACQLVPVQNPPVYCSTFGTSISTTTIVAAPSLQFQSSSYTVNENESSATIFVTRTGLSAGAVTVQYSTSNGTATAGSDFQSVSGTLSWVDGETTTKSFNVPILDDNLVEGSETVNLTLSSPGGGAILGNPATAVLTINDVENGEFNFTSSNYVVPEDGGAATIGIQRTGGSDGAVSVQFTMTGGSATAGVDYTDSSVQLSWADGESGIKNINIPIIDDNIVEGDETINLTLSNPSGGARIGPIGEAILTITDVENGELQFGSSTYNVAENAGIVTIEVIRAGGADGLVSVQYATSDGSAIAGSDYTTTTGTLSWANGEAGSKTFTIPILDDFIVEGDETINIALSNPTGGARLGNINTAIATITDVENGEIQFTSANYSVFEDQGLATIQITRTGGSDGAVSVQFTSANGSATAGADYTDSSAQVSWLDGESGVKTINIPIIDDNIVEGDETVNLTLSSPSGGARLGNQNSSVLTIIDVEHGVIQLSSATYSVAETGPVAVLSLERSNGGNGIVAVDWGTSDASAVAGSDYTASNGTVTWQDNEIGVKTIEIPIIDDNVSEGDETFNVTLDNATGGAVLGSINSAVITIIDGGIPGTLQFSSTNYTVNESEATITVTVTRTNGSKGAVSVDYSTADGTATEGADYSAVSGTLSWQDGENIDKTIVVSIINDNVDEQDETFALTLSNITGGAILGNINPATVTITDDDVAGTLQFSTANYSVAEDGGTVSIVVTRALGTSGPISVQYATSDNTAVAGEDYTAVSGTLTWADGDSASKTVNVPILNDDVLENDETLSITLSNSTGGATLGSPNPATIFITDSGAPGTLQFSANNYSVAEDAESFTVTVTRINGSKGQVSVDYSTSDGSASAGSDYSGVSGTLAWNDGDTSAKTFSIPIIMDDIEEQDETVMLAISNSLGGASLGTPSNAILTIQNISPQQGPGDPAGDLQFGSSTYSVSEDGGQITIDVLRINGSEGEVSINVRTINGSAAGGSDYGSIQNSLTWAHGDTGTKQLVISIFDDNEIEGNQSFTVELSGPTGGAQLGTPNVATVTIFDDDTTSGPVSNIRATSGTMVVRSFTISNPNSGLSIATINGAVDPSFIVGTSGKVTYSFTIPPTAIIGDVFTDTITITDSLNNQTIVPVSITVSAALVDNGNIAPEYLTVAEALDELCVDTASESLAAQCDNLAALDEVEQAKAVQQISPRQVVSQAATSVEMSSLQLTNIRARVVALRSGAGGLALNGLTLGVDEDTIPVGVLAKLLADEVTGGGASADSTTTDSRFGMFLNGKINFGEKDGTVNESGFQFDTKGITLGFDYRLTNEFFLGSALGYAATGADYESNGGGLDSKATSLSIYGSYYTPKNYYFDWILGYSGSDYHTTRNISYANVDATAEGDTGGDQILVGLNGGADFYKKSWLFGGYARLDYIQVQIDSYSETGGSGFALKLEEQTVDSFRTALGGKLSYAFSLNWGVITPSAYAEWEHEYKDDGRLIAATFVEDSRVPFAIPTDEPDRDYFNTGIGAVFTRPGGTTAFINYETMLGHSQVKSHSIDFGVRIEF
jgi:uncharacterized protein with beta-barrel porin domain/ribosomal protein L35AE/L33A